MIEIEYVDKLDTYWQCWVKSNLLPLEGDFVSLPKYGTQKVVKVQHMYKIDRDEFTVLSHVKIFVEWIA